MTDSALELFLISGSPFAWRVQLALALHGIDYTPQPLKASEGEHKKPDYLALNPRGMIPTLRDGEFVLRESIAILTYLNEKYGWQLFGTTPEERAIVWQQVCETESWLVPPGRQFARPVFFGGLEAKKKEVLAAAELLDKELARLDTHLSEVAWLVGDRFTAAEVATYPVVRFLERAGTRDAVGSLGLDFFPIARKYERVEAWLQRFEAVPGVKDTWPPNWKA